MNALETPARELLCALLHYDEETGILTWKTRDPSMFAGLKFSADATCRMWNSKFPRKRADRTARKGYRRVGIFNRNYAAHRIIWKMVHGTDACEVDHVDGDPSNNRLSNLREVTHSENMRNTKRPSTNVSGVAGVNWYKKNAKWSAYIKADRRKIHLGYFADFDSAVQARRAAEKSFGFHPNHGRAA